jgi:hypothetical protein
VETKYDSKVGGWCFKEVVGPFGIGVWKYKEGVGSFFQFC